MSPAFTSSRSSHERKLINASIFGSIISISRGVNKWRLPSFLLDITKAYVLSPVTEQISESIGV